MASRRLEDLHPVVKKKAEDFLHLCREKGLDVLIYETLRTVQEQDELYAKGRTKRGKIVTNARGGLSYHNYGLAFDCVPLVEGKAAWNRLDLFARLGQIGKAVGLEWGGDWPRLKDYVHFQWTGGLKVQELLSGKRPPEEI